MDAAIQIARDILKMSSGNERYKILAKAYLEDHMYVCTKCRVKYPLTYEYFHKFNNNKRGFDSVCKKCKNAIQRVRNRKYADQYKPHLWPKDLESTSKET